MFVRRTSVALLAATVVAGGGLARADTPPNMLVIGTDLGAIPTLDPAMLNARTVSEVISNFYDNLVQIPADDLQALEPMLAESWEVSPDGRTITMTMRDGMKGGSGKPIDAEDAAWSIQRVLLLGGVGTTDIAQWGFTAENVEKLVRAESPRKLVIELPEAVSPELVLDTLASSSLVILDKDMVLEHEKDGDLGREWLKANVAPTGAFSLGQYRPNDILLAEARADYWGGEPALRRVAMRHIPESGNLRLQLENGDVDVGQYLEAGDLEALAENPDVDIQNVPGFGFYYIALNMKDPDLQKPKVREAFQHVFDWEALARTNMRFNGFPWQEIVPKEMIGAGDGSGPYDYDIERAKQLLAEAGYPNGLKKKLYPAADSHLLNAESLQATARLAGIELELIPGRHVPAFRDRDFEVYTGNSGARLPDPFATATHYAFNPDNKDEAKLSSYYMWRTAWDNPELTELVDQGKRETDPEKRAAIFSELRQRYQDADPSLIVFFQRTDPYAVRAGVEGYEGHPTWSTRWKDVTKR